MLGASSESCRKEIARRTRRGLEGLARNHKPTGGRSYGYIAAAESESGDREINQVAAKVVLRIFEMRANGHSARSIAAALNRDGVPSPGSGWKRTTHRSSGWVMSAIAGDPTRGTGILNNELYLGRVIWNRSRWVRSAADSSKRRCVANPTSEWIVRQDERLRVVPQALWDQVKAAQKQQSDSIGDRVRRGLEAKSAKSTGRSPKFLFSGLPCLPAVPWNASCRGSWTNTGPW